MTPEDKQRMAERVCVKATHRGSNTSVLIMFLEQAVALMDEVERRVRRECIAIVDDMRDKYLDSAEHFNRRGQEQEANRLRANAAEDERIIRALKGTPEETKS